MDWDSRYIEGDTPWDKGYESPALHEIIENYDFSGNVWIPGSGIGYDARFIANRFPSASISAYDISKTAVDRANAHDNPENLEFILGDIFTCPGSNSCDMWFEHTCYCAIHPDMREAYVQTAARQIKPRGIFIGVFFVTENFDPQSA